MRTIAYCAESFTKSVRKAAGVDPLTSPPLTFTTFDTRELSGHRFIYFKLHGLPGESFWYGDGWISALSADQIRNVDLSGAVVFVANCHLYQVADDGAIMPGPMLTALLKAGARAVVGGCGKNWAKSHTLHGADRLGRHFRSALHIPGFSPRAAFRVARAQLAMSNHQDLSTLDTLAFRIFEEEP